GRPCGVGRPGRRRRRPARGDETLSAGAGPDHESHDPARRAAAGNPGAAFGGAARATQAIDGAGGQCSNQPTGGEGTMNLKSCIGLVLTVLGVGSAYGQAPKPQPEKFQAYSGVKQWIGQITYRRQVDGHYKLGDAYFNH